MAITMNLYYTGENGSALSFVKEMMESGTVEKIRKEKGISDTNTFKCSLILRPSC